RGSPSASISSSNVPLAGLYPANNPSTRTALAGSWSGESTGLGRAGSTIDAMRPGDFVGDRFSVLHLAGAGGMGEVYKALDQETGRPVAVKTLTRSRGDDAGRFAREARVLSALDH